eukprot:Phypoly_transcript_15164.p1 GENE.Phypoly_transcript_15164~~Phypoly_transcript_15164.p1  ORF type:complete len:291 (+),score=45.64 Phypoly_transcript_15164:54-926(+)
MLGSSVVRGTGVSAQLCKWSQVRLMSFGERLPQRAKRPPPYRSQQLVKIFSSDSDTNPVVKFESGTTIHQIRTFLNVRGGGLKYKGDAENVILKERSDGYEGGDYVLIGVQGMSASPRADPPYTTSSPSHNSTSTPNPYSSPQSFPSQPPNNPQYDTPQSNTHPSLMNPSIPQQSMIPPQFSQYPPSTNYHSASQPPNYPLSSMYPSSFPPSGPTRSSTPSHTSTNPQTSDGAPQQSSLSRFPPTNTPKSDNKPVSLTEAQVSLASELGMDTKELEMFPWLVTGDSNRPF